jgi:hypothetical protein
MRKFVIAGAVLAACPAAPAVAQSYIVNDVIAQSLMGVGSGRPNKCYDGRWTPSAELIAKGPARVEAAMANYRSVASVGTDLRKVIGSEGSRRWQLDGQVQDVRAVRDPFLPRAARLDLLSVTAANSSAYYRAQWRAVAADGTEIGIYDAVMFWRSIKFMSLDLYTPAATDRPVADTPFCQVPGDVEKFMAAKAKREEEKAAQRAANEAAH